MRLATTDTCTMTRDGRFLQVAFSRPHRVLSTCRVNGGLREDLTHLCNHQSCEGRGHSEWHDLVVGMGLAGYHAHACEQAGLPPATTALMSTAANMQAAVLGQASHEELSVTVAVTAGVHGNGLRAGDPAGWHEAPEGSRRITGASRFGPPGESPGGTIVCLAVINQPVSPACLCRAVTMITEGKSVAVLDLRMPSRQSSGLATGTGTDQLAVAAPLARAGEWERHWAGGHNTLGELLAGATRDAVRRCLLLQNGECPELRRSIDAALGRFGCDSASILAQAAARLNQHDAGLLEQNLRSVLADAQAAAAAYGLAGCADGIAAGIIHREAAGEALLNHAALLAACVALRHDAYDRYRAHLQSVVDRDQTDVAGLAREAVLLGFAEKWRR